MTENDIETNGIRMNKNRSQSWTLKTDCGDIVLFSDLPRDATNRPRWCFLESEQDNVRSEIIEREVRKILQCGVALNRSELKRAGIGGLDMVFQRLYPGGKQELLLKLGLSTSKPRNFWRDCRNIEEEAMKWVRSGGTLASTSLIKGGNRGLNAAITTYYPGGIYTLRSKLSLESTQRKHKPSGYWTEQAIELETGEFIKQEGSITSGLLKKRNREDLRGAIQTRYPGGMKAIYDLFGVVSTIKPHGYWTVEKIEEEANIFYEKNGRFSQSALVKSGRADLHGAIQAVYPGKFGALRVKLGLKAWAPRQSKEVYEQRQINREEMKTLPRVDRAKHIYQDEQDEKWVTALYIKLELGFHIIKKAGLPSGRMAGISIKQGLSRDGKLTTLYNQSEVIQRLNSDDGSQRIGYWTQERLENEALKYFQAYGDLALGTKGRSRRTLKNLISQKYPGGTQGMRVKLGIDAFPIILGSTKADEVLRRIVEG